MIGSDDVTPFDVIWTPFEDSFGDYQIAARAEGADGNISYIFLNLTIGFNIEISNIENLIKNVRARNLFALLCVIKNKIRKRTSPKFFRSAHSYVCILIYVNLFF